MQPAALCQGLADVQVTNTGESPQLRTVSGDVLGNAAMRRHPFHKGIGPRRNWLNLWKPTIDALDALLGQMVPAQPWHPREGRIVKLGLHQQVDNYLGHDVVLAIAAASVA